MYSVAPVSKSSPHQEVVVSLIRTADLLGRVIAGVVEPLGITAQQYNVPKTAAASAAGSSLDSFNNRELAQLAGLLGRARVRINQQFIERRSPA